MHRKHGLLAIFVAATVFAAAATHAAPPSAPVDVAAADNAFGFRLLNAVQKTIPNGNVVLSPVSAALNLSMVLNGAAGQTRQEMLAALSLSGSDIGAINTANAQLIKVIRTPAKSVTLSVADSLWVDNRRATLRPDYVKQTQAWYDAEMPILIFPTRVPRLGSTAGRPRKRRAGFPRSSTGSTRPIWCCFSTPCISRGSGRTNSTRRRRSNATSRLPAVPSNKCRAWRNRDASTTSKRRTCRRSACRSATGDLVMEVLLPAKSSSLGALEAALTPEHWTDWQAQYAPRPGKIELPRFELKSNYRLNEPLQTLGMTRAFHADGPDAAQLTGMFSVGAGSGPRRELLHFVGAAIDLLEGGRGRLRSRGRYDNR